MEVNPSASAESQKFIEMMNSLPTALRPVYTTEQTNQPIVLYQGHLKISQKINERSVYPLQGNGEIKYVWFPYPHIEFEFFCQNPSASPAVLTNIHEHSFLLTLSTLTDGHK